LCTAAAASNIIALITLNMIGYSVGVGGAQAIAKFLSWDGFVALLISFGYMWQKEGGFGNHFYLAVLALWLV